MAYLLSLIVCGFAFLAATHAETIVSLSSAAAFGVVASDSVIDSGSSIINGDLGLIYGSELSSSLLVRGNIYTEKDPTVVAAKADVYAAYSAGSAITNFTGLSGMNLGGRTLTPGAYNFPSSAQLTGVLTLNAQGSTTAQFVIQVASNLSSAAGSVVVLTGGAQACNVFFLVNGTVDLGPGMAFAGNILARLTITLGLRATSIGGVYSLDGGVVLNRNTVVRPGVCPKVVPTASLTTTPCPTTTLCPSATGCPSCSPCPVATGYPNNFRDGARLQKVIAPAEPGIPLLRETPNTRAPKILLTNRGTPISTPNHASGPLRAT
ncbi:MAG: hypothetical protein M1813_003899 [Trichoglossum hirsutum]|jgi:hypothetical protein|nr:MAG: hypothetical protein M1813_003899 [Trichoglossum hirsutum]